MSQIPLYQSKTTRRRSRLHQGRSYPGYFCTLKWAVVRARGFRPTRYFSYRGHLAHRKLSTPLGHPKDPRLRRLRPMVGS